MRFDCHVHTKISTDSKMDIRDAVKASKDKGIGLIITEHMDLNFPRPNEFVFDVDNYFNEYNPYRGDDLLLGIELGMDKDSVDMGKTICEREFDFVIGSVHMIDNMDIYEGNLYENKTKKEAFENYFKCMLDCIEKFPFIDTLGHIDYISRYARYDDKEIYYHEFSDFIDEILKYLSKNDKSIELNTRRFKDKKALENLITIYKRFYELGGRTVTIGSDCHSSDFIGQDLKLGYEIADLCNLKPVYYKERKIHFIHDYKAR